MDEKKPARAETTPKDVDPLLGRCVGRWRFRGDALPATSTGTRTAPAVDLEANLATHSRS
jgi:hypothetical protein